MLTSRQRSYLASLAQTREPLLMVGRAGESEGVVARLDDLLRSHELVKLRFADFKDEKPSISSSLAEKTKSEVVRLIGNTAIFYRTNPDPDKRKIEFPTVRNR